MENEYISYWLKPTISIVSILIAFIFGGLTIRHNTIRAKKQYSLTVLSMKFTNNDIFQAYKMMSDFIIKKQHIVPADLKDDEMVSLERLLAFFEFICVGYINRDIDRKIVEMQLKSGIRDTYKYCANYIESRRDSLVRPKLYSELETVARDHFGLS